MPHDSDTESEPESLFARNASDILPSRSNDSQNAENSASAMKVAVEMLKNIDRSAVSQDAGLHSDIQAASSDILDFLDDIIAAPLLSAEQVDSVLTAFASITHVSFLTILFDYRRIFHDIAARALNHAAASTTISWVDVVLAKFNDALVTIASGFLATSEPPISKGLKQQRDEDTLRAAAQLPQKWQAVPSVIAASHASPAAKRLALRLTFASCVVGPQLVAYDPWDTDGDMINVLQTLLQQLSHSCFLGADTATDIRLQERMSHSMVVSIFSAADTAQRERNTHNLPPFIPESYATLLRLIQVVMHPDEPSSNLALIVPCETLDAAQTILTQWGDIIPWSWSVWDDPRIMDTETITYLTVTWLYHLDIYLSDDTSYDSLEVLAVRLSPHLLKNSNVARCAMSQLLLHSLNTLCSPLRQERLLPPVLDVISKTCWAIVQLVDPTVSNGWKDPRTSSELCKCLYGIFVLLGDTPDENKIREHIVEAITHIDTSTIRHAFQSIKEDTSIGFVTKLNEKLARCKRTLFDQSGRITLLQSSLHASKVILNFLSIMWHSGTRGSLHPQTTSALLDSLVSQLLVEHRGSLPSKLLCNPLLTALATIETLRVDPAFGDVQVIWKDQSIWQAALTSGSSNLVVASAFAQYILASNRRCDSLYCAEAWDFFRDALLLALNGHFLGDNEPLALLVCPNICRALSCLVEKLDPAATQFILSSPWTLSICTDLRTLLKDESPQTEYRTVLKERLSEVGQTLLDLIAGRLRPSVEGYQIVIQKSSLTQSKLLFTRLDSESHLVLLPVP